jgi:hypothetical protein
MTERPTLPNQTRTRTALRVLGLVLLAAGLVLLVSGGREFISGATSDDVEDTSGLTGVLLLGAGGFLAVFGIGALNAGFLGAQARYVSGETMPVVKDSAAYLTDGQGVLGVGRTVDDREAATTGPYCRGCGTRNDPDARFCDGCGSALG